ncbi:hypothetical protein HOY80DRAFT_1109978 [Tuber brumale]|nr:hypothetical protein HOY80DRAFT_1109978 [Tuber brumale]
MEMDTIEVSHLKRNLRLLSSHVGKAMARVAGSSAVMSSIGGVAVATAPYHNSIQDDVQQRFMQFKLGICGRDHAEARRWINSTLVDEVDNDRLECLKPPTDGGTEISSDGRGFLNCGGVQECHAGNRFDKHHHPHILLHGGSRDHEPANPYLNQVMYIGNEAVYTHTFEHDKTGTFPDCGNIPTYFTVDHQWSQEAFMDRPKQKPEV